MPRPTSWDCQRQSWASFQGEQRQWQGGGCAPHLTVIPLRAGGTYRLTRLIGPSRTKDLIFSARLLNATQAHSLGIVDHVAQSGDAASYAVQKAEEMAVNGPIALRAAKVAIDRGQLMDIESGLDWERACYERCLGSKDRLEGLLAFAEKRKPKYTGE